MATSGDYQNYYMDGDERVSHIVDPRTGYPAGSSLASVSVVAETCAFADAWATALTVLGPDEGLRVAEDEELTVLFITREADGSFRPHASERFEAAFGSGGLL